LGHFEGVYFEGFHFSLILDLFLGGSWPGAPKRGQKGVKKGSIWGVPGGVHTLTHQKHPILGYFGHPVFRGLFLGSKNRRN
jgi:hypothetical protein